MMAISLLEEVCESMYSSCSVFSYLNSNVLIPVWSETGRSGKFVNEKIKEFHEHALEFHQRC